MGEREYSTKSHEKGNMFQVLAKRPWQEGGIYGKQHIEPNQASIDGVGEGHHNSGKICNKKKGIYGR